jgi:hypothetical protein
VKLSEKYKIMNLGPAHQSLGIEIHCNSSRISIGQISYIITILRQFGKKHTDDDSMPIYPNVKIDMAED